MLSKSGVQRSSEQFAQLVHAQTLVFVIGGPFGLDEERLLRHIDETVSFGTHTMPHGLVKVVLLEQLWRAHCINSHRSYHY
ncbi:MAG: 23S rRNA (pseudouridine(1915)-N(3))-methyltransferase RlmH [Candidatus Peribacteria bacterium]|nr:MAG: 23S rRNA (pseudouridine(1915)-N(3))-methyltransferase RlmH [Candidatus Peribacteria bacterium]